MMSYDMPPDHIYYNLLINNHKTTVQNYLDYSPVEYRELRTEPLVTNTKLYDFSITRFSVEGARLPLFLAVPEQNDTDANKTIYKFGIIGEYAIPADSLTYSNDVMENILWSSENKKLSKPSPPSSRTLVNQYLSNEYYFSYDLSHLVKVLNDNIATMWASLQDDFKAYYLAQTSSAGPDFITKPPQFYYDKTTGKFILYCDKNGFSDDYTSAGEAQQEKFTIYMNSNLYNLFKFSAENLGGDTENTLGKSGFHYKLTYQDNILGKSEETIGSTTYIKLQQPKITTSSGFSPVAQIVFTSNILPIQREFAGQDLDIYDETRNTQGSTTNNSIDIITDLELGLGRVEDIQDKIIYNPTAQYRYADISSSNDKIDKIGINILWKNRMNGNYHSLYLNNGGNCSIKMLFELKK